MDRDTQHAGAATGSRPGEGGRIADAWENGPQPQRAPTEAWSEVGTHLAELKAYAAHFLAAKTDGIKASFRNFGLYAALGVLGLLAGGAVVVTAFVLLLTGLAGAIGAIFDPDRPWVGAIVVGLVVLAGLAVGTIVMLKRVTTASRERTISKYEARQQQQRIRFGHNVQERAVQSGE